MSKPVCIIVGIGPGNGAALARRFAAEGYAVALLTRDQAYAGRLAAELDGARAYPCDASDPSSIETAFAAARRDLGDAAVLVYNAGSGVFGNVEELSVDAFESAWRINALGAFVASRQVIPAMKAHGGGAIVFIGATASRKGGARSAGFASAKAAQRTLAESMARHLWPSGIHVAVVIIDGVVDLPRTRERMPGKPDSFFVKPDAVAQTVVAIARQDRSAWSFEVEARPFGETW
ncbi:MAG TPA: SDR family NAD(P)-dependent oxidoreductase [Haliangiales bacterium]|nr:SDR family NAD(P)-dependent oxidoreductase [Haliangiales bacterium]